MSNYRFNKRAETGPKDKSLLSMLRKGMVEHKGEGGSTFTRMGLHKKGNSPHHLKLKALRSRMK